MSYIYSPLGKSMTTCVVIVLTWDMPPKTSAWNILNDLISFVSIRNKYSNEPVTLWHSFTSIACSHGANEREKSSTKPLTFIQAAMFQWVNPKAWTMALTAISIYAPSNSFIAVSFVAIIFGLINLPCIGSWIILRQRMQLFLTQKAHLKIFNISMVSLLVLSLYPAL